ncbi:hypothetical protein [Pseudonocardia sp. ICBG601]|uniref:hypothetical protein n=1 Tax=Pseudonocardia sp. ICBG601 TaxID=2846759 RepID=UPI001CF68F5D|nr:hypothetical protein [Pseudonocardia sp. ICBG601]
MRAGPDHERLQEPGRGRVWRRRGTSVTLVGLVLVSSPWGLASERDLGRWGDVLTVVVLAVVVPLAAVVWRESTRPYPHDRTMVVLRRAVPPAQRAAVATALRRGRPEDIPPGHLAYARAWTAQRGAGLVSPSALAVLMWAQMLNAAARAANPWFFLVGLSGAAVFTVAAGVEVALQRRRDRCLSTDRPDAGDRPS